MKITNVLNLPSGRIFLIKTADNYLIEATEMKDVSVDGKLHVEVRESADPHVIWQHLVPYQKKWLLTVSTQKGCSFNCKFCDVANHPFRGNLTQEEIESQIKILLQNSSWVTESEKVKIGFARMGEPALNLDNVLGAISNLPKISSALGRKFRWLPCFNTILPRSNGLEVINEVIDCKEKKYDGFLHFQISCNSTDESTRKQLFGGADVLTIDEIISAINQKDITNRTVTLNFIVMKGIEVDINKLKMLGLNKEKFAVKLIPLNRTLNAEKNQLKTYANYSNYKELLDLKRRFEAENIPVIVDAIAKCEEAGLCCGQLAQIFQ